jgi:hypothetical protein
MVVYLLASGLPASWLHTAAGALAGNAGSDAGRVNGFRKGDAGVSLEFRRFAPSTVHRHNVNIDQRICLCSVFRHGIVIDFAYWRRGVSARKGGVG